MGQFLEIALGTGIGVIAVMALESFTAWVRRG